MCECLSVVNIRCAGKVLYLAVVVTGALDDNGCMAFRCGCILSALGFADVASEAVDC